MQLLVNIDVDELERGIEFYRAAFGLRVRRRLFDGTVAEMIGASSTIHLVARSSGGGAYPFANSTRDYTRHWTPVHLDFEVEDLAAAVKRAVAAGAKLEGKVQKFAWGRLASLADPFGHGFCLIKLSKRGYDAAQ